MNKHVDNLVVEGAKIIWKNFSGRNDNGFNPDGKRSFHVIFENEEAIALKDLGWNIKQLKPRDEYEEEKGHLQVFLRYFDPESDSNSMDNRNPKIWLITKKSRTLLKESQIDSLDYAEIENVDVEIRPYYWEMNGKVGIKAMVKSMYVTIAEDPFEAKYFMDEE